MAFQLGEDDRAFHDALSEGRRVSTERRAELEAAVVADPQDVVARARLVGALWMKRPLAAARHASWFIENAPTSEAAVHSQVVFTNSPTLGAFGVRSWTKVLAATVSDDPRLAHILFNAARWASVIDPEHQRIWRERARALIQEEEPLGLLDHLEIADLARQHEAPAGPRLARMEALTRDDELQETHLDELAEVALDAGELDKATSYAGRLLARALATTEYPRHDHDPWLAHTILGRVALRRGDAAKAAQHLIHSADITAHPPFTFAGPPLRFAQEMLDAGECEAVLDFLAACSRFWEEKDLIDALSAQIRAGRTPDFGWRLDEATRSPGPELAQADADVFHEAYVEGHEMTPAQRSELEATLANQPDDLLTHVRLLGAYGLDPRAAAHGTWIIENAPTSAASVHTRIAFRHDPALVAQGIGSWARVIDAIRDDDRRLGHVLYNAAQWAWLTAPAQHRVWRERARTLLTTNGARATLDRLEVDDLATQRDAPAGPRFARMEWLTRNPRLRAQLLEELAEVAVEAGEHEKAMAYAGEHLAQARALPERHPRAERKRSLSHTILGRVALRRGELAQAAEHLARSADIQAAAALGTPGPKLRFAQEMLEAGQREAVLAYLDACRRFWDRADLLDGWVAEIRAGARPDFGWFLDHDQRR